MRPRWQAAIRGAVGFLRKHPSVDPDRVALIGYSRGAFLAVSVASSLPAVKGVVDYFGGMDTSLASAEEQMRGFPPLLILHGDADTVVPATRARQLEQAVKARGGEVETHIYPGAQHAFNASFSPAYSEAAALDSFRRMIDFLKRRLLSPVSPPK
jgi:dienelactone hydrolase